jgi:hypothetical protein
MSDRVRVLRILSYEGPREWVEMTVAKSIHGTKHVEREQASITGVTIGDFPEILNQEADPFQGLDHEWAVFQALDFMYQDHADGSTEELNAERDQIARVILFGIERARRAR